MQLILFLNCHKLWWTNSPEVLIPTGMQHQENCPLQNIKFSEFQYISKVVYQLPLHIPNPFHHSPPKKIHTISVIYYAFFSCKQLFYYMSLDLQFWIYLKNKTIQCLTWGLDPFACDRGINLSVARIRTSFSYVWIALHPMSAPSFTQSQMDTVLSPLFCYHKKGYFVYSCTRLDKRVFNLLEYKFCSRIAGLCAKPTFSH